MKLSTGKVMLIAAIVAVLALAYRADVANMRYYAHLAYCGDSRGLYVGKDYLGYLEYAYRPPHTVWNRNLGYLTAGRFASSLIFAPDRFFCTQEEVEYWGYIRSPSCAYCPE